MDLVDNFSKKGGEYLFIDEVHKYPGWAQVLKNIYDDYLNLKVVFTGSSLLEILNARADLSRRAVVYEMQGFSFREYLRMETGVDFDILSLEQILNNHVSEAKKIHQKIKPFQYFETYLQQGYDHSDENVPRFRANRNALPKILESDGDKLPLKRTFL